jgi:hypothetical protein
MLIVIQCAGRKSDQAGYLKTRDQKRVSFIAYPQEYTEPKSLLAHPDDLSDRGMSWRDMLLAYNEDPGDNPLGLLPAWQLYTPPAYKSLVKTFGVANVYILSAGWGLIKSDFLTPCYDITFSAKADAYMRRKKRDTYKDLCQLPMDTTEPVVFLGGKDYLPLFCQLSQGYNGERSIFYNSKIAPKAPSCNLVRYETTKRTNWHYECAQALVDGRIGIE